MQHKAKNSVLHKFGMCCAGILLGSVIHAASFTPLGDLPGGNFQSIATDVSADGRVVVGQGTGTSTSHPFRWTPEDGMVALRDPTGDLFCCGAANAVSADGGVVVGYAANSALNREAFRWTPGTEMVGLGLLPDGSLESSVSDVSADGSVLVGRSDSVASSTEAFRWTADQGMVGLGRAPGAAFSLAAAVSADGSVVVGQSGNRDALSNFEEAFRWTAGSGIVGLGYFPGNWRRSGASDVSADGSVVVGYAYLDSGNAGAFRWTSETGMISLGSLPDSREDIAFGTSGDGNVVVGRSYGRFGNPDEAFIWTQIAGMRNLRDVLVARGSTGLDGWILSSANAVSENGRWVVGMGINPSGNFEAFLADTLIHFNDVPLDHWAIDFIHKFADSQISRGCGNGNFCPEERVTRAQMAVFLERGMRGHDFIPRAARGNVFADVAAEDFAAAFIEQLSADSITGGCGGNNYCPSDPVTRAQMAVFLLRSKHGATYMPPPPSGTEFGDVDSSHWAVAWIEQLAAEGITSGCGGGNFCPGQSVSRAQMAVFMVRTFGL
jgi:probable HAF family extracellular repeat protein